MALEHKALGAAQATIRFGNGTTLQGLGGGEGVVRQRLPEAGPVLCAGDFIWTDGQPGQPFPLESLEALRLKWNEAAFLTGKSLRLTSKS